MRNGLVAGLLVAVLTACAGAVDQAPGAPPPSAAANAPTPLGAPPPAPPPPMTAAPDGGSALLSALGTPFLIAFKIPVCVLTIIVAAPVAAMSELSDAATPAGADLRNDLSAGITSNCGPPYVVTP